MGGATPKRKDYQESARNELARLTLEKARITLAWASTTFGTKTVFLYAPGEDETLQAHPELMRCAMGEAGLVCGASAQFNVAQAPNVSKLTCELRQAGAIIILDDANFRAARFAKRCIFLIEDTHTNPPIVVVRHGNTTGHEDLEFYLRTAEQMHIYELDHWLLAGTFLIEAVAKSKPA